MSTSMTCAGDHKRPLKAAATAAVTAAIFSAATLGESSNPNFAALATRHPSLQGTSLREPRAVLGLRAEVSPETGAKRASSGPPSVCLLGTALGAAGLLNRRHRRTCTRSSVSRRAFFNIGSPSDGKKTVIVTGASSGLGLAATCELARSGDWCVIMACRDFLKAEKVAKENNLPEGSFIVMHCDLASQNSVKRFVESFRAIGRPLDALVCNAAVYFPNAHKTGVFLPGLFPGGGARFTPEGYEMSFATNYLGHFLLCNLLMEDLQKSSVKPARCIILGTVTASVNDKEVGGMIPPIADLGSLEGLQEGMKKPITMMNAGEFDGAKAYKDSKVADVMLMKELHRRYHASTGIAFTSLYPGCIAETNLFREHYPLFQALFPVFQKNITKAYVSEEEAGKRLAKCVADPKYSTSGSYYTWGGESGTGGEGGTDAADNSEKSQDWFLQYGSFRTLTVDEIGGAAGDDVNAKKLWELSSKLCGLDH